MFDKVEETKQSHLDLQNLEILERFRSGSAISDSGHSLSAKMRQKMDQKGNICAAVCYLIFCADRPTDPRRGWTGIPIFNSRGLIEFEDN
jgi:hypothetical protein